MLAKEISAGHAFEKHVLKNQEFAFNTVGAFEKHIETVLNSPSTLTKPLLKDRTAFWCDNTSTIVVHDPKRWDGGTAFKPGNGKDYFTTEIK